MSIGKTLTGMKPFNKSEFGFREQEAAMAVK
jgi:hypothetical protein